MPREYFLIISVSTLMVPIAYGADTLDETIVSGTRLPQAERVVDGSLTIIDKKQIELIQPLNVQDLFRRIPGIDVMQAGGSGGSLEILLRGGDPNFTMILLDGVKVNNPTNSRGGSFDFSQLDPKNIERIEVIHGGLSAVYGSDALSGVINIITKSPSSELDQSISYTYGNRGLNIGRYLISGRVSKALNFSLQANLSDSGEQTEGSILKRTSLNGRFYGQLGSQTNWQLAAFWSDVSTSSFPDASGGPTLAVLRDLATRNSEQYNLSGSLRHSVMENVTLQIQGYIVNHQEQAKSPAVAPGIDFGIPATLDNTDFKRSEIIVHSEWSVTENISFVGGGAWQREEGINDGLVDFVFFQAPTSYILDRNIYSVFAESSYTAKNMQASLSVRHDDTKTGSATTMRVGGSFNLIGKDTWVTAHYGEGFKLPSFAALGHALVGNPDLLPEESKNLDINLSHRTLDGKLNLRATYFRNHYINLIDFDAELFLNVNRGKVHVSGVELSANYKPTAALLLDMSVTHTDADIVNSDDILRSRPAWKGNLSLSWQPSPDWGVMANFQLVGRFYDFAEPVGTISLNGYERVDISGFYHLGKGIRLSLVIDNIFNSGYQQFIGFNAPGRSMRTTISREF